MASDGATQLLVVYHCRFIKNTPLFSRHVTSPKALSNFLIKSLLTLAETSDCINWISITVNDRHEVKSQPGVNLD